QVPDAQRHDGDGNQARPEGDLLSGAAAAGPREPRDRGGRTADRGAPGAEARGQLPRGVARANGPARRPAPGDRAGRCRRAPGHRDHRDIDPGGYLGAADARRGRLVVRDRPGGRPGARPAGPDPLEALPEVEVVEVDVATLGGERRRRRLGFRMLLLDRAQHDLLEDEGDDPHQDPDEPSLEAADALDGRGPGTRAHVAPASASARLLTSATTM